MYKNMGFIIALQIVTSVIVTVGILALFFSETATENTGIEQNTLPATTVATIEDGVPDLVEKVLPAVVSIAVFKDVPQFDRFDFNFFGFPSYEQNGVSEQQVGNGSGFFVTADGYIITNRHVVSDDSARYVVVKNDGTTMNAEVIDRDTVYDLAVLKVETNSSQPYLELSEEGARVGETVIAVGNALGEFSNSVSLGIVSGLSRSIIAGNMMGQSEQLSGVIQTDAAINPGNSGGPLLRLDGTVVGVNVAVAQRSENVGFALPANIVQPTVESIRSSGRIIRPLLGVRYLEITEIMAEELDLPVQVGAFVQSQGQEPAVVPRSTADVAGVQEGDIIIAVNGTEITASLQLAEIIRQQKVGDIVSIKIIRGGEETTLEAVLQEL
jgi:serine protease Do